VGYVTGGANQFGEKNTPIKVSGTIQRKDLEQTTITSENVEAYSFGYLYKNADKPQNDAKTTFYVTCANN
jgi:hypothetical protein